jgi:IS5 family transposase
MHCNPDVRIVHRGKSKRLSAQERKLLERRQTIEPIIGHLKADHRMDRCHLKGETGDRLHAVLCTAGYNIRWLLRMIARKGIRALLALLFTCCGWPQWDRNRSRPACCTRNRRSDEYFRND